MQTPLVIGYVRVSTDLQNLSVEAQTEQIRRFCSAYNLADPVILTDEDVSGGCPFEQRPNGARAMLALQEAVKAGRQACIITSKVDRFGRDTIDVAQTVRTIDAMGASVHFLDINVDTKTPMGRAFMQIAAVFAELERARIKERVNAGLAQKRTRGELCGTVPFGWNAIETGEVNPKGTKIKTLQPNPVEQNWILHMHAWRKAGHGYHTIANFLNSHGAPTKTGKGKWQAGNVSHVLNNATVQAWLEQQQSKAA